MRVNLFFDEADVAAPFDARYPDVGKVVCVCAKPHVFVQIMLWDVIAPHHRYVAFAIPHNHVRLAFDQNAEPMGIEGEKSEEAMEQDQNHASSERREESRRPVNRSRKNCRNDDEQHGVEWSFSRERPFVSNSHGRERNKKNNYPAEGNLNEGQILRFDAETEHGFKRIPECIHS